MREIKDLGLNCHEVKKAYLKTNQSFLESEFTKSLNPDRH